MSNDINEKLTVTVTIDEHDNFIVKNLENNEKRTLPVNKFWSSSFKYASDFESIFLATFEGKSNVLLDEKAKSRMQNIIHFNRIDN